MQTFEIKSYGEGNETRKYNIEVKDGVTVRQVIDDIVSDTREWGYIGIKEYYKKEFFGSHRFEYRNGKKIKPTNEQDIFFWDSISDWRVVGIEGEGGWSNSNYQLIVQSF